MAKRIKKLERFEGGLNIGAAQRDIDDNQFVEAENISIHNIGSIKVLGEFVEHEATLDSGNPGQEAAKTSNRPGYGLFSFQSDYKMLDTDGTFLDGTSNIVGASKYLLLYNISNGGTASIFQNNEGTLDWNADALASEIDLGDAGADLVFYSYNGAVRLADASNSTNSTTQWLGAITPKIYGASKTGPTPEASTDTQTYESYGVRFTRNEAFVYRTSEEGGHSGVGATNAKWFKMNNVIKGAFEEGRNGDSDICCLNAIMTSTASTFQWQGADYANTIPNAESGGFGFADEFTDIGIRHDYTVINGEESNMRWGAGLSYREGETGTGTWMPNEDTRYKFYITTMYDDMTQESLPQLMAMYSSPNLTPTYTATTLRFEDYSSFYGGTGYDAIIDTDNNFLKYGFAPGQAINVSGFTVASNNFEDNVTVTLTAVSASHLIFEQNGGSGSQMDEAAGASVTITVADSYEFTGTEPGDVIPKESKDLGSGPGGPTASGAGDAEVVIWNSFHLSWHTKTAESEISFCDFRKLAATGTNTSAWFSPIFKINGSEHGDHGLDYYLDNPKYSRKFVFGNGNDASAVNYGNPRISGVRMYWASNEDGYSTLWQMFDVDFAKGVKSYGIDSSSGGTGYAPFHHISLHPHSHYFGTQTDTSTTTGLYLQPSFPSTNKWLHPPRFRTYFENNGHDHDDVIDVDYYKTAVVANDRVYIGNVGQTIDGVAERFPDRILKSPYGQPDKFPSKDYLQIGDNDGDAIIHLATFADRLLQFNNNVMYIINISQDAEYIEDVHKFKGVHHPASVCTTDDGVMWVNENGVFAYTGKNVVNILESKSGRLIDDVTWKDFVTNWAGNIQPAIGYSPKKREIIVVEDMSHQGGGSMYIFNTKTGGWIFSSVPMPLGDNYRTNFYNDYNNDLIYFNYNDDKMYKWDNTPSDKGSGTFNIKTKDIDFGNPATRKKIYKVYITYKCSADTNVHPRYNVNGSTGDTSIFEDSTFFDKNGGLQNTDSEWAQAELKPNDISEANNIYSFQLIFVSIGTVPADFEINDISIVYKEKSIK